MIAAIGLIAAIGFISLLWMGAANVARSKALAGFVAVAGTVMIAMLALWLI